MNSEEIEKDALLFAATHVDILKPAALAKKAYLSGFKAGFKAGIDAKSCCCNLCTLHSIAVEQKIGENYVD